eukprot:6008182-Pleurochrysis_carterae.AAC.1
MLEDPWDDLKAHYQQQLPEASQHASYYDEVRDEGSRGQEWHALEQAEERQASLDSYAAFYLLLFRHGLMSRSDAFLGILSVFFRLAAPSTTSGTSSSDAETSTFFYDGYGCVTMKLDSTSHLEEVIRLSIIYTSPVGSNFYHLRGAFANEIIVAFALR